MESFDAGASWHTLLRILQAAFDSDRSNVSLAGPQVGSAKVFGLGQTGLRRVWTVDDLYLGRVLRIMIEVIWEHGGGLRPLDRPIWPCTGQFFQCGDLPPAPQAVFGKARVQLSAVWTQIRSR